MCVNNDLRVAVKYAAIFTAFFLLVSCAFVSFERLSIWSNIDGKKMELISGDAVVYFQADPVRTEAENLITLKQNGQTVRASFEWHGTVLLIKPAIGWKKGGFYSLTVNGTLCFVDGRMYKAFLDEYFYYGGRASFLTLDSVSPLFGSYVMQNSPLIFTFNKPVQINSFYEAFKTSPQRETRIQFSADGSIVTVTAKNGWEINKFYDWQLSSLHAEDGFSIEYEYSGRFYTTIDVEYPRVLGAYLAQLGTSIQYFASPIDSLPPPLYGDEPIGLVFSKQMDFFAASQAVSLDPSLKHYFVRDNNAGDRFLFVPLEPYAAGVRYCLTISNSAKDVAGLSPIAETKLYFETTNSHLEIFNVILDSITDVSAIGSIRALSAQKEIITHTLAQADKIDVQFSFSQAFTAAAQKTALQYVSITSLFPASASVPTAVYASWNPLSQRTLSVSWQNVSASSGSASVNYYYKITIAGGKNGISNGYGAYLEEDICIIVQL